MWHEKVRFSQHVVFLGGWVGGWVGVTDRLLARSLARVLVNDFICNSKWESLR